MSYSSAVLADSPVDYWTMKESTGTFADQGSNNLPATFVAGTRGSIALSPDPGAASVLTSGTNFAATRAWSANIPQAQPYSIEFLIQPTTLTASTEYPVVGFGTAGANGWLAGCFGTDAEFNLSGTRHVANWGGFVTGTTYHCVYVISGTTVTYYVDGTSVGTPSTLGTETNNPSVQLGIGAISGGAVYVGYVSDVALYNTALSSTQVTAHYNAFAGGGGTTTNVSADATQSQSASVARRVFRSFPIAQAQSSAAIAVKAKGVSVAAAQGQAPSVVELIMNAGIGVTATQSQSAAISRAETRTLRANQPQSSVAVRGLARTLGGTQTQSASVAQIKAKGVTVAATQPAALKFIRRPSRTLAITQAQSVAFSAQPSNVVPAGPAPRICDPTVAALVIYTSLATVKPYTSQATPTAYSSTAKAQVYQSFATLVPYTSAATTKSCSGGT